jgi:hypothetical protein
MSFILDALKKIEEDKRRGEANQATDVFAVGRSRGSSSRSVIVMVAIALASAALTGTLLLTRPTSVVDSSVRGESPVPLTKETDVAEPPPSVPVTSSPLARPRKQTLLTPSPAPPSAPLPKLLRAPSPEPVATDPEPEPAAVFRLVGKESPRIFGGYLSAGEVADDAAPGESIGDEDLLPGHFPNLVLQGTSVIDGEPVAVINDQRVFERDRVEGARVMEIKERVVELELEGQRFKIRLLP